MNDTVPEKKGHMKKIGELLVENRIITQENLETALKRQQELGIKKPLGEILVEMKVITIDSLITYLELQLKQKYKGLIITGNTTETDTEQQSD